MESIINIQKQYIAKMNGISKRYSINHKGKEIILLPKVFPPYVDSFLMIETMEINEGDIVLDACSGSGIIALFACNKAKEVIATDISQYAIENINENIKLHSLQNKMKAIETDLFPPNNTLKFDVITINPPYTNYKANGIVERSVWDENNNTIKQFFSELDTFLSKDGKVFLGWADFSNMSLIETLCSEYNYNCRIVGKKRDNTSLFVVYKIEKQINENE